jgi:hypothetical protein
MARYVFVRVLLLDQSTGKIVRIDPPLSPAHSRSNDENTHAYLSRGTSQQKKLTWRASFFLSCCSKITKNNEVLHKRLLLSKARD